ncbi:hypothetical protein F511_10140 [Dorcoceras hygrometricum]|uniref:Uncharacterized protein n=1 Tax=Dorcoceras hygrometricum TaxID=472368 RepID=A0A2Z7BRY4_9LAMI|nr:hypothetical protein F511_10140 [Dorcoceras hygrometricum]
MPVNPRVRTLLAYLLPAMNLKSELSLESLPDRKMQLLNSKFDTDITQSPVSHRWSLYLELPAGTSIIHCVGLALSWFCIYAIWFPVACWFSKQLKFQNALTGWYLDCVRVYVSCGGTNKQTPFSGPTDTVQSTRILAPAITSRLNDEESGSYQNAAMSKYEDNKDLSIIVAATTTPVSKLESKVQALLKKELFNGLAALSYQMAEIVAFLKDGDAKKGEMEKYKLCLYENQIGTSELTQKPK